MNRWWLWVSAGLGVVLSLAAGWKIYFAAEPGAALIALVVAGALLVVSPLLLPRLHTIAAGVDGFELRLVQEIADQGAPGTARLLNRTELAEFAEVYRMVNAHLADRQFEPARMQIQDHLVGRAAAFARSHTFDPDEVRQLFPKATAAVRVLLLGLMKGDARLVDAGTLTSAIDVPVSGNEQYQALRLVQRNWKRFTETEQAGLLASVQKADLGPSGNGRHTIAAEIIAFAS